MALSDEQNAMLRLLASGEQGYDDIAALMGLSVTEVRAKVVGALAQLEAEGKPAPDIPPPGPAGAKPAAEAAAPGPEATPELSEPALAPEPSEPAPSEEKPPAPAAPAAPVPKPAPEAASPLPSPPSPRRTITLPSGRGAWLLGGGVIAAIVVIVVVILLVSGGGSGNSSSTASGTTTPGAETGATEKTSESSGGTKQPTQARLVAVDGSEAEGRATFGRVKNKLALAVEATGLEPTEAGTSYTVWLAQSATKMLPLASTAVKASGKGAGDIAAEFEVPVEVLGYLADGTFAEIAITRTEDAKIDAAIKVAKQEKTTPAYTGEEVLHGQITGPIVGLAKREEEEKE
ncbi:MAG TPA: hypothetical protein VHA76_06755 [Solirubrobacterales bacterium]|nr:hypothetical protein [Solirubrobacterales bacterium]